jgi:hypothetical protein
VLGAGEREGVGAEALHDEGEVGQRRRVGQRLADQAERAHVHGRRVVELRDGVTEKPGLSEQPQEFAEVLVAVALILVAGGAPLDLGGDELRDARRQPPVLVVEKGRLFVKQVRHDFVNRES